MVHKPKHKVHSFRGLLADGGQDEISLERSNLNLAYRIVKFEIFPNLPGTSASETTIQIWREKQDSISSDTATVDFDNTDLLAASFLGVGSNAKETSSLVTIFDNVLFSRNIYVTHTNTDGSDSCNYYIEIEEVPVNAATLMQIKLGVARKLISGKIGPTPA